MRSRSSEAPSSFPHFVALGSLVFALGLFFANTVPALREQQSLGQVEDELSDLRRRYEDAIRLAQLGVGSRHDYDLQSLLVAIDQLGYTPYELCAAHPPRPAVVPVDAASTDDAAQDGATPR